jgi:hypothetical protein
MLALGAARRAKRVNLVNEDDGGRVLSSKLKQHTDLRTGMQQGRLL